MLTRTLVSLTLTMPLPLAVEPSPGDANGCINWDYDTLECLDLSEDTELDDLPGEEWDAPATEVNQVPCYYVGVSDPQPHPYEDFWDGHRDESGNPVGISLDCAYAPVGQYLRWRYWAPAPPGGITPPIPEELARQAAEQLNIEDPEIGIAPDDDPDSVGIIGLPVWGWLDNPGESTMGPLHAQAGQGPFTVEVTATVDELRWDWDDDIVTECSPPGTPYEEGFGKRTSPDCGHDGYQTQGKKDVTLTAVWRIEWEGMGAYGTLEPREVTDTTTITEAEWQVLRQ